MIEFNPVKLDMISVGLQRNSRQKLQADERAVYFSVCAGLDKTSSLTSKLCADFAFSVVVVGDIAEPRQ